MEILTNLTDGLKRDVTVHAKDGISFFPLASEEISGEILDENVKKKLTRNPALSRAIENFSGFGSDEYRGDNDFGYLLLSNVSRIELPLDNLGQMYTTKY